MTSLELECHFAYTDPLPPPVHTFPSLRSLSLLFVPAHHRCIALCSSLTSLALWHPDAFALHSLASPSTPLHRSLTSLTIHNAWLETALTPLTSFSRLASLSFLSCTIDPCDLHALARSLHTLTHLAVHDCPMIPSHSLAALAESNPALASLSLHSTSHFLFIARSLRDLFLSSSSRLHTLTLSGLPSYRPGMLARCSSLQCLTLRGREAARGTILPSESPQKPSLDCIVAMLVRVEQLGAPEGPEGGGDGVERWKGAMVGEAAAAAAAAAGEAETEDEEAAAGRAEFVAAMDNWMALTETSKWKLKKAATEALRWRRLHHGVGALDFISQAVVQVRSAILVCRCVRLAKAEMKGWSAREAALAKACRAAEAAGVFTAAVEEEVEEEVGVEPERDDEEGRGGQGIDVEEVVRYMPEDDLEDDLAAVSEKLLAWVVVPRADARELLHALMELVLLEMEDMGARFEIHDPAQPHPAILPGLAIVPTFESLARAAVCGRLKSLALLNCCGLEEGQLVELLRACGMLEDLRVQGCDGFSGSVIAGSRLEVLNRLSVVGCGGITADAIGRLLGNVPRLQYLEVEGDKVSERARRELLRTCIEIHAVRAYPFLMNTRFESLSSITTPVSPSPYPSPSPPLPPPPFSPSLPRLPPLRLPHPTPPFPQVLRVRFREMLFETPQTDCSPAIPVFLSPSSFPPSPLFLSPFPFPPSSVPPFPLPPRPNRSPARTANPSACSPPTDDARRRATYPPIATLRGGGSSVGSSHRTNRGGFRRGGVAGAITVQSHATWHRWCDKVRKPIKYTVGLARTKSPWTWGISTIEPPMKIYVGDTLEFKWASPNTVDDVVQLFSKASWTSCALASKSERLAAQAKKGTVAYKIPDKYRGMWVYFASSAGIDCAKGQKFKVFVNKLDSKAPTHVDPLERGRSKLYIYVDLLCLSRMMRTLLRFGWITTPP
ncbi:unnamed protein product [Closterium sp. Naga37s-1]|nr:unnamed protein product [Closterium sp. Naga37s-1]